MCLGLLHTVCVALELKVSNVEQLNFTNHEYNYKL